MARSFTKGADPAKNTRNTRGKTREITRGNTRESLNQQEIVTHVLDPRNTNGDTRSTVNRDDTKVAGLLHQEVLMFFSARRS